MPRRPLQRRLTLITTLTVTLAIAVSNLAGYAALNFTLTYASQGIALSIARDLTGPIADDVRSGQALGEDVRQSAGVVVEAVHPDGRVLQVPGSPALVVDVRDLAAAAPEAKIVRRVGVDTTGSRYAVVAASVEDTGWAVVVARPVGPLDQILAVQRVILLVVCALSVFASALVAAQVARSALRPVRELTQAVEHVTNTNDLTPVSVRYATGDLAFLAASFNLMLRSLTSNRERQTRMVADAGHELRTPLTSLRTNIELLAGDRHRGRLTEDQTTEIFTDVQAQLGELGNLIGDLVHLARDDTTLTLAPLDLRDTVNAALDRVRSRTGGRTFAVDLEPFYVIANREALERVVVNLLDNAVKWSPPSGIVRVELTGNRLTVSDAGPGIPTADLPYVFDRFFRGQTGAKTPGTGLGLSIVAKTVQELGGTVHAGTSAEGGAEFTVQLPGVTHPDAIPTLLVSTQSATST